MRSNLSGHVELLSGMQCGCGTGVNTVQQLGWNNEVYCGIDSRRADTRLAWAALCLRMRVGLKTKALNTPYRPPSLRFTAVCSGAEASGHTLFPMGETKLYLKKQLW